MTDQPRGRRRLQDITGSFRIPRPEYADLLDEHGNIDHDEQVRIFEVLLPAQTRPAVVRFFIMLTLSVTIAVMGLVANSVAVVIGAMLIAPLMTPIMTFAAAVGLGLGLRAVQAAFLVISGTLWSVGFAFVLAKLIPDITIGSELLGRTRPDVRDLVVAIAAGAAGAYATARKDISAALPGVAVAVALVPPLAATGVLLESGQRVLAEGSGLLYVTNLLAIIVSALLVLLFTGVLPTVRLFLRSPRIFLTAVGVVIATVLVAIPLTTRSIEASESSRQRTNVASQVAEWIGVLNLEVNNVDVSGATVTVELTGLDDPPPAYTLATRLVPLLGADAEVIVRWDQRAQGVARADSPPAADPVPVVRAVITEWLAGLSAQGYGFDLLDLSVTDTKVTVAVGGPIAPPAAPWLPNEVADALGRPVDLAVRWIQQIDQGVQGEAPQVRLDRFVRAWIGPRTDVRLMNAAIAGTTVVIDLGVNGAPLGLDVLHQLALEAVSGATRVEIRTVPMTVVQPTPDVMAPPDLD